MRDRRYRPYTTAQPAILSKPTSPGSGTEENAPCRTRLEEPKGALGVMNNVPDAAVTEFLMAEMFARDAVVSSPVPPMLKLRNVTAAPVDGPGDEGPENCTEICRAFALVAPFGVTTVIEGFVPPSTVFHT